MHYTRLLLLTLLSCLQLALFAQIDMQAHVASDEGKDAYKTYTTKQNAYYTGDYSYNTLYNLTEDALFSKLTTLMGNTSKHKNSGYSYDALKEQYVNVDKDLNRADNEDYILDAYDGARINGTWDGGNTYDREHTWPQSKGSDKGIPMGYDMHCVRPLHPGVNSKRGNLGYGEDTKVYFDPDNFIYPNSHPLAGQSVKNTHPYYKETNLGTSRGDVARCIIYYYMMYGEAPNGSKGAYYNEAAQLLDKLGSDGVFESLRILIKWHMQDPPSLIEMVRNDGTHDYQGNRNPFIDYPELALQMVKHNTTELATPVYTITESSAATMNPAHRYTLSDGFIAYLTNNDGSHPQDIKVTGATKTYDKSTGRLTITNVTGNMTISDVAASTYTLAWNANGGQLSGTYSSGSIAPGTAITAPTATRSGYQFTGWSPNFTGTMPSANTTYTAQWQAQATYTVTWMANGSVHSTRTYNANGTQSLILPADPTPCDGWTFVGWTTEPDYSTPFCQPADLFTTASGKVTSNLTYYAVFKKD